MSAREKQEQDLLQDVCLFATPWEIVEFVGQRRKDFDYIFYDYRCLGQAMPIESLEQVDSLYAHSPCLCLTNNRYRAFLNYA